MFKRKNKITALLVAAASIMSIVPAMADDTTATRLTTDNGNITNAIAYSNGKYVYQGYKSSDDTDQIYYNDGSQDKSLDDISSADLNTTYADKYGFANDGSNQYLVDLTSGDINSDTTPSDDIDTAATKLQTKLKKASRYGSSLSALTATDNLGYSGNDNAVGVLPGNKFGDNWYSYKVTPDSTDSEKYVDKNGYLYGFTNASGEYIDASYLANVYAYSSKEGRTVKISDYSNSYDDVDSDSGLLATLAGQPVVLTQDKDYIYALVNVAITDTSTAAKATATTTSASAYVTSGTNSTGTAVTTLRTYVQKIAKAQGDQKDDAYLPKSVDSYEVGNSDGSEYTSSDAENAYAAIKNALGVDPADATQANAVATSSSNDGLVKPKFVAANGNLIAIDASSSSVDATTLLFKKDKLKYETAPGYRSSGATLSSDTKVDVYIMEKDSDDSVDLNDGTNTDPAEAYDIDVDGNIWTVADGKIYEYENGSMTKVYTCDSSLDSISVYDANSLIAWANNGDVYTTINGGNAANNSTTTSGAATTQQTGWVQLSDGTWNYYDATGTKVVNNWANVGGVWYYLGANGTMATGWVNDNGTWYFLKSSGAMATGWVNDNGTWYYLNASGAMLANTTVDGYVLGASGAWIQ
ncbi:N-acetylmuramoyl-L-alanine amidase family protein [uncultured Clostridium sp.]|uniref:N-acetylmuramoyl-L-alanine amidase family protein n=1 Tax=uncultured Clostridium sp. TaxID=59620 RepID=UPI0028F0DA0A|nr:N-acetylmuramoyl-L-alanine amidase family protein [uncultured Clostridium sp.]